jgi:hypothetical protein
MKSLTPFIIIILLVAATAPFATSAFAHPRSESVCKHTTLYVLTFPPQREKVILCHPVGKTLAKINKANEQYNARQEYLAGKLAAEKASSGINFTGWKCPSTNKDFCRAWNLFARSSEGCGGDYTCVNPVQPPHTKGCVNDRNYKG